MMLYRSYCALWGDKATQRLAKTQHLAIRAKMDFFLIVYLPNVGVYHRMSVNENQQVDYRQELKHLQYSLGPAFHGRSCKMLPDVVLRMSRRAFSDRISTLNNLVS
jgi:hypothetical protein